jgi:hypothetical protein
MGFTAIIIGLALVACGLGVCGVAHRIFKRADGTDAHCAVPTKYGSGWRKMAPVFVSALICGLAMAVVLAFVPSP